MTSTAAQASAIMGDRKLGQILVEQKFINLKQVSDALYAQQEMRLKNQKVFKLGEILLFTEQINLPQLQAALSKQQHKVRENRNVIIQAQRSIEAKSAKRIEARRRDKSKAGILGILRGVFSK